MAFRITITREAESQLRALSVRERRILEPAVLTRLRDRPTATAKAIKQTAPPQSAHRIRTTRRRPLCSV
jgi:mRNA-degrading endonuclease RelE of RelBE toxin-antitoxin system